MRYRQIINFPFYFICMIVHIWKRESIEKKKIPEKLKLIFRDKPEPKMKNVLSVILRRIITLSDILRLKSCFYFWILYTSDFSAGTRKRIVDINTVFRNITEMFDYNFHRENYILYCYCYQVWVIMFTRTCLIQVVRRQLQVSAFIH